jgi:hypothetical protein
MSDTPAALVTNGSVYTAPGRVNVLVNNARVRPLTRFPTGVLRGPLRRPSGG